MQHSILFLCCLAACGKPSVVQDDGSFAKLIAAIDQHPQFSIYDPHFRTYIGSAKGNCADYCLRDNWREIYADQVKDLDSCLVQDGVHVFDRYILANTSLEQRTFLTNAEAAQYLLAQQTWISGFTDYASKYEKEHYKEYFFGFQNKVFCLRTSTQEYDCSRRLIAWIKTILGDDDGFYLKNEFD